MVLIDILIPAWAAFFPTPMPCPEDMVPVGQHACIDRLPFPNYEGEPPLLGLSAIRENYLNLDGSTWDAETLCASRGKRLCTWREWQDACAGTMDDQCPALKAYIAPDWSRVAARIPSEMMKLDQHSSPLDYPRCMGTSGARMMGQIEEWVRLPHGYGFSRGFWSRTATCHAINTTHSERFHDYATGARCCLDR